ncbi:hypothetical protein [Lacinutrix sp.]|uniref:hypothetical protein n=1 Tax=Lacinutrix sp. TaxID=1937692 RepID=UPI0025C312E6|nr:hypothetical protein [Lacinutrix sp.]
MAVGIQGDFNPFNNTVLPTPGPPRTKTLGLESLPKISVIILISESRPEIFSKTSLFASAILSVQ